MDMLEISKPKLRPPFITLLSDSGMGKTSLASLFPVPIFIRTEDGLESIPEASKPDAFPLVNKVDDLMRQLLFLATKEHPYQTVVLDSVTQAEAMFVRHIVATDANKPMSINQALGGFGAGMRAVGALHARVRSALQICNDRGMTVVCIAHADTETVEPPDADNYTRYTMRLGKHSIAPYVDQADLVGFIKLETFTKGNKEDNKKKASSYGDRVLVCYATAANVSKNRYHIKDDLALPEGVNPLLEFIPWFAQEQPEASEDEDPEGE